MGRIARFFGRDKEKKVDDAAEKGSWLPGPIGDAARTVRAGRKAEDEVDERTK